MKKNIVLVCILLAFIASGSVFFISSSLAAPYTTAESQNQELKKNIEHNDSQLSDTTNEMVIQEESGDQEASFSDTQDQQLMEEKNWEEQEGMEKESLESLESLEEEPLEKIDGIEVPPEENLEAPLPAE